MFLAKIIAMKTISVPIAHARNGLCALVKKANSGVRIVLTSYGQPKAVIMPFGAQARPWRTDKPDDPARYGDLQSPVMEPWP